MKYEQPYGVSDPNAPYINGDPSAGIAGSIPPAASIEFPQREIVNFITDSSLTPTNADLHQLAKAVQSGHVVYGNDVGPVNAVAIALTPILPAYIDGMIFRVKVANGNTGLATFNAGPGPINIVRRGGGTLQAGDLPANYISMLTYNQAHNNVELYGANFATSSLVPILGGNTIWYINGSTGDDTLYDGTSATISGSHGPFKTIGRGMAEVFKYGPSVYTATLQVAAGTYPEAIATPRIPGPTVIISGAGPTQTFVTGANNAHTFSCIGANQMTVQNLCASSDRSGTGPPCCFVATYGGTLETKNTASGNCTAYIWSSYGGYIVITGSHTFNGGTHCLQVFAAGFGGFLNIGQNLTFTIAGAFYCQDFAVAASDGSIATPVPGAPTFVGAGSVSGYSGAGCYKYYADMCGCINTQGQSVNFFPGNLAGIVQRGGQYG